MVIVRLFHLLVCRVYRTDVVVNSPGPLSTTPVLVLVQTLKGDGERTTRYRSYILIYNWRLFPWTGNPIPYILGEWGTLVVDTDILSRL